MTIEAMIAKAKVDREAKGLKATYKNAEGTFFDMYHPTEAHKAFYDFKYALKVKYATEADVPVKDLKTLRSLRDAMTAVALPFETLSDCKP
jgi:hypothetical protein